jgi:hypothetical protein
VKIAIHQPQYMPWMGYFHKMASADLFVLLDDVQFKKNEWQHRNRIRNARGWQWLSVPTTFSFGQRINEVNVKNDKPWEEKHLRSLAACYAGAPHYDAFVGPIAGYYRKRRALMSEVAADSVRLLASMLDISTGLELSSPYGFDGVSTRRLVNICRHFGADTYLAGAGGRDYMDMTLFAEAGITVRFQRFTCPVYPQRWSGTPQDFIPNLSALDLLVNCGQGSRALLMTAGQWEEGDGAKA